ncbi:MAG TPA: RAMP superfamily CRISPR-associated protein [Mycobacteriales bacterium]|nr:RAMP superfamily CRISPR-associated protein [Mycobacteriales bacterium]
MATVTFVRFDLTFDEPGGVLTPQPLRKDEPDLVPDKDTTGRSHIPGTSLAGALRELVRSHAGEERAKVLFGHLLPQGTGQDSVDAVASPIWVYGAWLVGAEPDLIRRASTAIDRHRGAARTNTLRCEELLPAGTQFRAYLRWDGAAKQDLDDVLDLLRTWRPLIGHGTSRGRGRCTVGSVRHGRLDLTKPDDLLVWLTCSGPGLADRVTTTKLSAGDLIPGPEQAARLAVTIRGPLRVGSGTSTDGAAGAKVALIMREDGKPLIPGSGLKGVIRSRVEFILRSVGASACTDQRCGTCRPCRLFGYGGGHDDKSSVGGRGRFRFLDAAVSEYQCGERTHVAIDRFTGGAAGQAPDPTAPPKQSAAPDPAGRGLLYTVQTLEKGTFDLVIEPLNACPADREDLTALLRLVAEDLNAGLIGIGGGIARGYGSVDVDTAGLPSLADARGRLATMIPAGSVNGGGDA